MEKRTAKVNISAAGGTAAKGSRTCKVTLPTTWPVSYTHLDVYKRQPYCFEDDEEERALRRLERETQ